MKSAGNFLAVFVVVSAFFSARADDVAMSNPYSGITERNVFSLVPIPTNSPVVDPPPDPPMKITPNGIMDIFGQLEVLFKVAVPAQGKESAHDQSYSMSEGEREDDIEVVKIDGKAAVITFNNHGVIQELPLSDTPKITASVASVAGGNPGNGGGVPMPSGAQTANAGGNGNVIGISGLVNARARNAAAVASNASSSPSSSGGTTAGVNNQQSELQKLSPEEQIIAIEKERARMLDANDPAAVLMPNTPLTKQVLGEDTSSDK